MQEYDERLIRKFGYNPDKSIVYQSLKSFLYPTFLIEKINPDHKAILYAKKKKRYAKGKTRNYEKVALLVRYALPLLSFSFLLICFISSIIEPDTLAMIISKAGILTIVLLCITILHELLHIAVFEKLNIDYRIEPKSIAKIPLVIQIKSEYFKEPFNKLTKEKRLQYLAIALSPYIIIFPLATFLYLTPNPLTSITGLIILMTHMLNLPLEFI